MYRYDEHRPWLLTDEGQRVFLAFRDKAKSMLGQTGAFTLGCALHWVPSVGDSFRMIAVVERMVELGELIVLKHPSGNSSSEVYTKP